MGISIPSFHACELTGERVILRAPRQRDYSAWYEIRSVHKASLQPFEPLWPDNYLTEGFYTAKLEYQKTAWLRDTGYAFHIFDRPSYEANAPDLIGGVSINHVERGVILAAQLGYWLSPAAQGKGYMQESLQLTIDFARDVLKLHRLNAAIIPHNSPSRKVLERLNFSKEGHAQSYIRINGIWEDHDLYGLVLEEFRDTD